MAIQTKDGWKCSYCGKFHTHPELADSCRDGHDIVYVPIALDDLNRLIHFLYNPKHDLLEGTKVVQILRQALRKKNAEKLTSGQEENTDMFSLRGEDIKDR